MAIISGIISVLPVAISPDEFSKIVKIISHLDWEKFVTNAFNFPWFSIVYTGLLSTAFALWIEVMIFCYHCFKIKPSLFCSYFPCIFQIVSLKDVSATEAAIVYTLEPLFGAMFAMILLGERWGVKEWIGAAIILSWFIIVFQFSQE